MNQLRSELRKVLSTKTWIWLTVGSVALSALVTFLIWYGTKQNPSNGSAGFDTDVQSVKNVFAAGGASKSYMFALIIGAVAMTSEFRFGTIVPTLLTTPRREKPVLFKLLALAIIAGLMALITLVVTFAMAFILLATTPHVAIPYSSVVLIALGTMLTFVLSAIMGVSLGALLRNQILAVVLAILWVLIIEGVLTLLLGLIHASAVQKYLPGAAVDAIVNITAPNGGTDNVLLQPWAGALVLLGYALVFMLAAFATTLRRDVN